MHTPRRLLAIGTALLAVLAAPVLASALAAWLARPTMIDGFPVGPLAACDAGQECDVVIAAARAALDQRDPGHPRVVGADFHAEGVSPLPRRSEGFSIVVFRLADGSERATGVLCSVGGCVGTADYPG